MDGDNALSFSTSRGEKMLACSAIKQNGSNICCTAGGSSGHVLMVSSEYRATSACTLRDTFYHENQCEAWTKKSFTL